MKVICCAAVQTGTACADIHSRVHPGVGVPTAKDQTVKAVLERLSLRTKMRLIALMALAMAAVPGAYSLLDSVADWRLTRTEVAGLAPAAELMQVMRSTQLHRGRANGVLNGDESGSADRESIAQKLRTQATALDAAMAGLGDAALTQRVTAQRAELGQLLDAVQQRSLKAPESFARHTRLVDDQIALLYDVSVVSGLVLHPEAVGYFLQDAGLHQMPPLIEALARLRGSAMGLLARGEASAADRAALTALVMRARLQADAVDKALKLAIKTEPALGANLDSPMREASTLLREGLALADSRVIQPATLEEKPAVWWAQLTRAIDAQYALSDAARGALEQSIAAHAARVQRQLAVVVGFLVLAAAVFLWFNGAVSGQIGHALGGAVQMAEAVAAGDLSRRVQASGSDECARMLRALDGMTLSLSTTVAAVRDNASQVAIASAQIAQGNLDLSNRTEQQASSLQQTAASIEQLGATVTHTADNARQAHQLADTARDVATRGGAAVGEMVTTMKEIDVSSRRIGDIIGTIDGIAFQTNILALNAAVEAARAGEQGRGFAVVAGEVRSLAQRSAEAAREVRSLIGASVERTERGSAQADRAGATMSEIVTAIDHVSALMADINTATAEQSSGVQQVDQAMGEIDRATQQNAALVEESAAAADSLRRQAESLRQAMEGFRLA